MARFRGTVEGGRSQASRLGHTSTGLRVHANGWDVGVSVYAQAFTDKDEFHIYATAGSNGKWRAGSLIGLVRLVDGTPTFIPADPQE